MAYRVRNIIIGAAAIYISEIDSTESAFYGTGGETAVALPTMTPGTSSAAAFEADDDWRHLGFTNDGVEFSYEPDYGEVEVDQMMDAAVMFKQGQTASVSTTLTEATLENLLIAWGQPTSSLTTTGDTEAELGISSGQLLDEPVERSFAFIGPAPRSAAGLKRERVYQLRRVLNVEQSSHSLAKTEATTIPVSFRCLPDPYYTGKEYGIIRDRNIQTS